MNCLSLQLMNICLINIFLFADAVMYDVTISLTRSQGMMICDTYWFETNCLKIIFGMKIKQFEAIGSVVESIVLKISNILSDTKIEELNDHLVPVPSEHWRS